MQELFNDYIQKKRVVVGANVNQNALENVENLSTNNRLENDAAPKNSRKKSTSTSNKKESE